MGGASSALDPVIKTVDKLSPVIDAPTKAIKSTTGVDLGVLNPVAPVLNLGQVAKRELIDKPKAFGQKTDKLTDDIAAKQEGQLADIQSRKDQEKAQSEATTELQKRRSKQRKRSAAKGGTGRRSTILTDNLGSVGGAAAEGRKTLLGL